MNSRQKLELAIATHEAGHAVIARHLGLPIALATIVPDPEERTLGHVEYVDNPPSWGTPQCREFWGSTVVDLAGPLAERYVRAALGMACNFCWDRDCDDLEDGWPLRCVQKRYATASCDCWDPECDKCGPWPVSGHPSLTEARQALDFDEVQPRVMVLVRQCLEYLGDPVICAAIDAVKDELMRKKVLDQNDLDRLDAVGFQFHLFDENGEEIQDDEEVQDDDEWYIELVLANVDLFEDKVRVGSSILERPSSPPAAGENSQL